jgi:hypothetical protein
VTFKGSGLSNLEKILRQFPRTFTVKQVQEQCGLTIGEIRQAMVWGQQTDSVRIVSERSGVDGGPATVVYENAQWRKEWLMRAWHGTVASSEQEAG